ncbi:MAG: Outer rane lipoprotein omp16 precursor, partial [Deltaproteobacteria bacterium]|nr:Outer rane lipoprotein omp16 precursor [Deltaproteobacteria bacterium]
SCGGAINAGTGRYAFTPTDPVTTPCNVSVQVCDSGAPQQCATQTTAVTVTLVNDPPVITSTAPATTTKLVQYVYGATATDPDVPTQTLTWSLGAADSCGGAINASTGRYTFTASNFTPCIVAVTVCDSGAPQQCTSQQTNVTIESCQLAIETGTPQTAVVNTAFADPLAVVVTDAGGSPLSGFAVTFSTPATGASAAITGTTTTDGTGQVGVTATANGNAGGYTVAASTDCAAAPVTFSLTNLAGAAASIAVTGGNSQSAVVTTAYAAPLAVTVLDADGNPVSGVAVTFSPPTSGASASLSSTVVVTDGAGVAQPNATANTVAGAFQITAAIGGAVTPASFSLTNLPGPAASLQVVSGDGQATLVSTAFAAPLVVVALDQFDNVVPGIDVTFVAPGTSPSAVLTPSSSVTTDGNGRASVTAVADDTDGTYPVTASLAGGQVANFVLTNTPIPPIVIVAESGGSQTPTVNTAFGAPLVVLVTQGGSPLAGAAVTFSAPSTDPTATLGATTATTDATGHAQVTATASTGAGAYVIVATATNATGPAEFPETNQPDAAASIVADPTSTPQTSQVGTAFSVPLGATVLDQFGNPVPGVDVTFAPPASGASATLNATTITTDANGRVSATATATAVAGSYTIDATAPGVVGAAQFALANSSGAPSFITVVSGTPQVTTVGTAFGAPLVARVTDASGNPVPNTSVTFTPPASGASATTSAATAVTDGSGFAQVNASANTVTGNYQVAATIVGGATPAQFDLANRPDAPQTLTIDALSTPQSALVGTPYPVPLRAVVADQFGNPVPGVTVTYAAPSSEPTVTLSTTSPATDANGTTSVVAVAGTMAGTFPVTATVTGVAPGTFTLTNLPPSVGPAAITVAGGGQTTLATTEFPAPLVIRVTDASGDPVAGVAVNLALPSTGPSATASTTAPVTDSNGEATITLTANAEPGMFAAIASAAGAAAPVMATFTITPIPTTTTIEATPSSPTIDGTVTLTATVVSEHGTPTGIVHFLVDGHDIGTGMLIDGALTITVDATTVALGSHEVIATFDASGPFGASSSATAVVVIGSDSGSLNGGGGCAIGRDGPGGGWILLPLVVALWMGWRRRGKLASSTLALVLIAALEPSARAQATESPGAAIDVFRSAAAGSDWFTLDSLDFRGHLRLALRGLLEPAHNPLVNYAADGSMRSLVVSNQFFMHAGASLVVRSRYRFSLAVPLALHQGTEPSFFEGIRVDPSGSGGVGDLAASGDVRILGRYGDPVELAAGLTVLFPTGSQAGFRGDGSMGGYPHVNAAGQVGLVAWAAELGLAIRRGARIGNVNFGNELRFRAATGLRLLHARMLVGPELYGAADLGSSAGDPRETSLEGDLGARYQLAAAWAIRLGVGTGLAKSPGIPDWRALLSVDWKPAVAEAAPRRARLPVAAAAPIDGDGDGVTDDLDPCPAVPAGPHPDPDRHGCPEQDRDGDGVFDRADQCPEVAATTHPDEHKPGCPDQDSDGDGVYDSADLCVAETAGRNPDPAKSGCPKPDLDKDSVPDDVDACPPKPGAPGPDPKKNGCPGLVVITGSQIVILEQVQFATDKDTILKSSYPILQAVANTLTSVPTITSVSIEGHTDNKGASAHNQDLSERRAQSVMKWLVDHGIEAGRLSAHGFGDTRRLQDNATAAGRAKNRRVEFHIADPNAAPP